MTTMMMMMMMQRQTDAVRAKCVWDVTDSTRSHTATLRLIHQQQNDSFKLNNSDILLSCLRDRERRGTATQRNAQHAVRRRIACERCRGK